MTNRLVIGICLTLLSGVCLAETNSRLLVGKWKSVVVEGKRTSAEYSYWEFRQDGTLRIVKWDDGRIEQSLTARWQETSSGDSTYLVIQASGQLVKLPMFMSQDSMITIDPTRLDRPYKGRTVWMRVDPANVTPSQDESATPERPTEEQIITAVHRALSQKVPGALVRYATGGEKAQIFELRINAKGKPQTGVNTTYWPVKMFSRGTCVVLFGGKRPFEGEIEYFIYQDPYGDWKAEYRGL